MEHKRHRLAVASVPPHVSEQAFLETCRASIRAKKGRKMETSGENAARCSEQALNR